MKSKLSLYILLLNLVFSCFAGVANATSVMYEDTDLLNCWRVTSQGYIYTPVSLTAKVLINYEQVSGQDFITMYREDLIASTLAQYWASYPNATMNVGTLNIRGTNQSLPNVGTYLYDPSYVVTGRYNDTQKIFGTTPSAGYGQAVFFCGTGGYQTNNTAQVDFNW